MSAPHYTCPRCRATVPAGRFCTQCGQQLAGKSRTGWWAIVLILALGGAGYTAFRVVPPGSGAPWPAPAPELEIAYTWSYRGNNGVLIRLTNLTNRPLRGIRIEADTYDPDNRDGLNIGGRRGHETLTDGVDLPPNGKSHPLIFSVRYETIRNVTATETDPAGQAHPLVLRQIVSPEPPGILGAEPGVTYGGHAGGP